MTEFIIRNKFVLLILVISILPLYSLFNPTLLYTQDGYTHLIRGAAYFKAISEFNIPPRWAGDLNYGYGMPLFIFVFQLPYQLYALFISFGFSLSFIFKLLLFASYSLSGVFMYIFAREFLGDEKKGFMVAVLYQFFPYRFTDLLLRGSIGEAFTFSFLPLLLWGIVLLNKKTSFRAIFTIIASSSFLVLSHLATGGVFILVSLLFAIFFSKNLKKIVASFSSIVFGFLVSSYYLFPAIIEHKYTYGDLFATNLFKENLVPFQKLFSWAVVNEKSIRMGDVPVNLGIAYVVLLIGLTASVFLIKNYKRHEQKIITLSVIIVAVSIFMTLELSRPIWENVTLLRQFQFPWRFLAPAGFALSLFAGVLSVYLKKKIYWMVIFLVILLSIPFWVPQLGYKKMDERALWNFPMTTTYFGETDVIWSAGPAKGYPKERVEVISGKGKISNIKKGNNRLEFKSEGETALRLVAHVEYFPGWKAVVNGQKTPIQFQDPNHRGELVFDAPRGTSEVVLLFSEDKIRLISNFISLLSLAFIFPFAFLVKRFL